MMIYFQNRFQKPHFQAILAVLLVSLAGLTACSDNSPASPPPTTAQALPATTAANQLTTAASTILAVQPTAPAPITAIPAITTPVTTASNPTSAALTTAAPTATTALPTQAPATTTAPAPTAAPITTAAADTSKLGYIETMRARTYGSGPIRLGQLYEQNSRYKANLITYDSDGLTISGLMFVPAGQGPFPLALINHGHFAFNNYGPGWDTLRELRYFAANGYVTIASDYRNYGSSSKGDYTIAPGYTNDILNLIEAAKQADYIDKTRITMMGHSMGSEITQQVLVVSKDVKVAALFGAMSADSADNFYARRDRWHSETIKEAVSYYGTPDQNPDVYKKLSPLTYFKDVSVPVQIHIGSNDTTCPPEWSTKIYNALKAAGKTTEIYSYPGEGHSLNGVAFDQAMQRTLNFFDKAIGK